MVQSVETFAKFLFSANKISAVITANEPWLSSSTDHSSQGHDKAVRLQ